MSGSMSGSRFASSGSSFGGTSRTVSGSRGYSGHIGSGHTLGTSFGHSGSSSSSSFSGSRAFSSSSGLHGSTTGMRSTSNGGAFHGNSFHNTTFNGSRSGSWSGSGWHGNTWHGGWNNGWHGGWHGGWGGWHGGWGWGFGWGWGWGRMVESLVVGTWLGILGAFVCMVGVTRVYAYPYPVYPNYNDASSAVFGHVHAEAFSQRSGAFAGFSSCAAAERNWHGFERSGRWPGWRDYADGESCAGADTGATGAG